MPITSKYLFVASMDVDPDKEDLFNEVYDTEHIPNLLKVPGVYAVTRIRTNLRREYRRCRAAGHAHGVTVQRPLRDRGAARAGQRSVGQAVELGRWPSQVRPYTRNRQHALYQVC